MSKRPWQGPSHVWAGPQVAGVAMQPQPAKKFLHVALPSALNVPAQLFSVHSRCGPQVWAVAVHAQPLLAALEQ